MTSCGPDWNVFAHTRFTLSAVPFLHPPRPSPRTLAHTFATVPTLRVAFASVLPVSLTKKTTSWQLKAVVVRRNALWGRPCDSAALCPGTMRILPWWSDHAGGRSESRGDNQLGIRGYQCAALPRRGLERRVVLCRLKIVRGGVQPYQVVLRNITLPRGSNVGTAEEATKSVGAGELHTPGIRGSAADEPVCSEYVPQCRALDLCKRGAKRRRHRHRDQELG